MKKVMLTKDYISEKFNLNLDDIKIISTKVGTLIEICDTNNLFRLRININKKNHYV